MNDEAYGGQMNQTHNSVERGDSAEPQLCRQCGFNLKGLAKFRACPECGASVQRSLFGDQLRFSDPEWVQTLASGTRWILWSVLLGLAIVVLVIVTDIIDGPIDPSVSAMLGIPTLFMWLFGGWLVTTPEPDVVETSGFVLRRALRWTIVCSVALSLIATSIQVIESRIPTAITVVQWPVSYACVFLLAVYARRMALRIPDHSLAKQTKIVIWGLLVVYLGFFTLALSPNYSNGMPPAIVPPACVFFVALIVFPIWSVVLLFRYNRAASNAAEQAWAANPPV